MTSLNEAPSPAKTGKKRNKSFKRRLNDVQNVINTLFAKKAEAVTTYKYVLIPPSEWKVVKDCKSAMDKVHLQGKVTNFKYNDKKAFMINSLVNVKGQIIPVGKEQWKLEKLDFKATLFLSNLPFLFSKEMALELGNFIGTVDVVNIPNDSSCHIGTGNILFSEINTKSVLNISELSIGGSKIFCKWSKQTILNIDSFVKKSNEKQSSKSVRADNKKAQTSEKNSEEKNPETGNSEKPTEKDKSPDAETLKKSNLEKKDELPEGEVPEKENGVPNAENQAMDIEFSDIDESPSVTGSSPCDTVNSLAGDKAKDNEDTDEGVAVDKVAVDKVAVDAKTLDNQSSIDNNKTSTNFAVDKQGSGRLRGLATLLKNSTNPEKENIPTKKRKKRPENSTKSPEDKKKIKFNSNSSGEDDNVSSSVGDEEHQ